MKRFHVILHPTDFSPGSAQAFRYACDLARDYDIRLVVLHVVQPTTPMVVDGVVIPDEKTETDDAAWKQLDAMRPEGSSVRLEKQLREGPAVLTIIEAAHDLQADLIVMGTHGRTGFGRFVIGSVAEEVVRKASCPVLTVKTEKPRTAGGGSG